MSGGRGWPSQGSRSPVFGRLPPEDSRLSALRIGTPDVYPLPLRDTLHSLKVCIREGCQSMPLYSAG